ncbi:MAG: carbohydrate ABC transporter permease [Chloroflexota bacterium]|nr:carbohydrate ABC transporter permease [Chloroflexota bacterium]MDE3193117.1 carbohydrate ABC transporter permease [Chloroflexota bacterium]
MGRVRRAPLYLALVAGGVVMAFPFYWTLSTSLKSEAGAAAFPPSLLPEEWLFSNYAAAWLSAPFGRYFLNSAIMAVGQVLLSIATCSLAAYALARMRVPGRNAIFGALVATLVIPPEVTLIPNYITIGRLGWYDTYLALIVPFGASVFNVFLLRQAFLQLPTELYEAAVLEGATHFRFLRSVALPLVRPTVAIIALLTAIRAWNDFQWPLIITNTAELRPIQVGLTVFRSDVSTNVQLLMAASVLAVAPVVVLFLLTQRQFIQGIARAGIRG